MCKSQLGLNLRRVRIFLSGNVDGGRTKHGSQPSVSIKRQAARLVLREGPPPRPDNPRLHGDTPPPLNDIVRGIYKENNIMFKVRAGPDGGILESTVITLPLECKQIAEGETQTLDRQWRFARRGGCRLRRSAGLGHRGMRSAVASRSSRVPKMQPGLSRHSTCRHQNIRVRTVRGQQYRCQSGIKFHGGLEQRFILVDCRSVLYGTYSYTWSFEKINVSMVLVVTGQLVSSYDEEFRRLYARSTVPEALHKERSHVEYLRDAAPLRSPNSSQLSLHQLHVRSRGTRGLRGLAQDELLTRGLSVQDRLHLSHFSDHMTRGQSFGGDLQKLNPMTRLRMGTREVGAPVVPDGAGSSLLAPARMSHQHVRHQGRYGLDQNLIPFNSETSLHRWKMDTYLNSQVNLDGSCDALSPLTSPYGSRAVLNDHRPRGINNRSRDIKSRLDEMRQKRLSYQEYDSLRHSQESLRSMYQSLDRPKFKSSLRGLDVRQNVAEEAGGPDDANRRNLDSNRADDGDRSASYFDIQTSPEQKAGPAYEWYEPIARTPSAAQLEDKLKDSSLKYPGGLQRPRTMESLIEIPEEKEVCGNPVLTAAVLKDRNSGNEDKTSKMHLTEKNSGSQEAKSGPRETNKAPSHEKGTLPKTLTAGEVKGHHHREEFPLQRKKSTRLKGSEEKKASKKEEKSLQRKASLRSQNSCSSNSRASLLAKASATEHRSSQSSAVENEKPKSSFTFHRLSSQRSSKRKSNPAAAGPQQGSRENLEEQGKGAYESRREKACSRYEYLLHSRVPAHKAKRGGGGQPPNSPTQSGADNRLGRFMQRVGNLIGKNK
ncbi:protein FAM83B-like [Hippocampus comes]|uniref:protein FAM83B-like n=1 Tax=Hippocampus comes TaxID=109280 RepID=UPI00094E2723|nr:PREDICTED: protein FAM83B-like [Hippocampus comes]